MTVRDEERALLAQELHDGLSAELTALRYALARLAPMPGDTRGGLPSTAALADADAALEAAFKEIRRLIDERRPPTPEDDPVAHLAHWVHAFAQRVALDITFDCPHRPAPAAIDPDLAVALLRITQEALNNVAKHAGATAVLVRLEMLPTGTSLLIRDNGRGWRADQARQMHPFGSPDCGTDCDNDSDTDRGTRGGMGMSNMRQRCEALRGTLEWRPGPNGSGLEIQATLPRRH